MLLNGFEEFLENVLDELSKVNIRSLTSIRNIRVVEDTLEEFKYSRLARNPR